MVGLTVLEQAAPTAPARQAGTDFQALMHTDLQTHWQQESATGHIRAMVTTIRSGRYIPTTVIPA